jgi:hypothetical protein
MAEGLAGPSGLLLRSGWLSEGGQPTPGSVAPLKGAQGYHYTAYLNSCGMPWYLKQKRLASAQNVTALVSRAIPLGSTSTGGGRDEGHEECGSEGG